MYHKNYPELLESCDIFWLKCFEFSNISQIFEMQIVKPILKHVISKFSVQKQQFYAQFEIFSRNKYINGFKIFRWTFTYKLCPKKFPWGL